MRNYTNLHEVCLRLQHSSANETYPFSLYVGCIFGKPYMFSKDLTSGRVNWR